MSNRTTIVASAVIAGCISIGGIASFSIGTARAAGEEARSAPNECLAAPKATTPAGAHWYYRVEKGTGRKCWYLGDAGAKVKKPRETASSSRTDETAPAPGPASMQESIANARAELTDGQTADDSKLAESVWPPLAPSADAAVRENNQIGAIQPAPQPSAQQGWNIASRWPEQRGAAPADPSAGNDANPDQPAPALTPDHLVRAAAVSTQTTTQTAPPTAAAQPDKTVETFDFLSGDATFSLRVLLSVVVCVLALAAIVGPMMFRSGAPRRRSEARGHQEQRAIWDKVDSDSSEALQQDNSRPPPGRPYADPPPEARVLDEAVDELETLLARASRRPAA